MPRIERTAHVTWEGNAARGAGRLSADTGAFTELPFSVPTRVGAAEGKTSPEELLAAAHAGCLSMSLASELARAGAPPATLRVDATIVMDEVGGEGHQIVGSQVTISGVDDDDLIEVAHNGCPFSTLLRKAGAEVTITRA